MPKKSKQAKHHRYNFINAVKSSNQSLINLPFKDVYLKIKVFTMTSVLMMVLSWFVLPLILSMASLILSAVSLYDTILNRSFKYTKTANAYRILNVAIILLIIFELLVSAHLGKDINILN